MILPRERLSVRRQAVSERRPESLCQQHASVLHTSTVISSASQTWLHDGRHGPTGSATVSITFFRTPCPSCDIPPVIPPAAHSYMHVG